MGLVVGLVISILIGSFAVSWTLLKRYDEKQKSDQGRTLKGQEYLCIGEKLSMLTESPDIIQRLPGLKGEISSSPTTADIVGSRKIQAAVHIGRPDNELYRSTRQNIERRFGEVVEEDESLQAGNVEIYANFRVQPARDYTEQEEGGQRDRTPTVYAADERKSPLGSQQQSTESNYQNHILVELKHNHTASITVGLTRAAKTLSKEESFSQVHMEPSLSCVSMTSNVLTGTPSTVADFSTGQPM